MLDHVIFDVLSREWFYVSSATSEYDRTTAAEFVLHDFCDVLTSDLILLAIVAFSAVLLSTPASPAFLSVNIHAHT